jgi:hypothetical protein
VSPTALLDALEARGIRLRPDGDRLAYEAPPGVLKEAEREALRAHKAAVLDLLRERRARAAPAGTDWRRVRLADLHHVLEIAVPWTDVPLILAPGCRVARELRARDPKAGRVWCTCEVLDLLLTGVTPEDARKIAEAKLLFNGAVVGARREGR